MNHEPVIERDVHEDGDFSPNYIPKFTTPQEFIDEKVTILREHLKIELTDEDITYLRSFSKEHEINAAVKKIINKYWE